MKNILIILLTTIAFFALLWFAIVGFSKHIYSRTDCERFNIDNIEMRAEIDIPAITSVNCNCDESTKNSVFVLDKGEVDLTEYIQKNEFVKKENVYVNEGQRFDTKWRAVLNPETHELAVTIEYL